MNSASSHANFLLQGYHCCYSSGVSDWAQSLTSSFTALFVSSSRNPMTNLDTGNPAYSASFVGHHTASLVMVLSPLPCGAPEWHFSFPARYAIWMRAFQCDSKNSSIPSTLALLSLLHPPRTYNNLCCNPFGFWRHSICSGFPALCCSRLQRLHKSGDYQTQHPS